MNRDNKGGRQSGQRVDLFAPCGLSDDQLHPDFLTLRDSPMYAPARDVLRDLQSGFVDTDIGFVERFQTRGFDARLFDMYLAALFSASGLAFAPGASTT